MARSSPVQAWLNQIRKSWILLAQGAAWVLTILGGFLMPPPSSLAMGEDNIWMRFAQFFIAVLVGLIFFGVIRWKQKKHATRWWMAAAGSLFLATALFFAYQHFFAIWTGDYYGQKLVVGSEYTTVGRNYVEKNPGIPLSILLGDYIGRAEDIWTQESISRRRWILAGIYMLALPLFTVSLISVVQAIQCLTSTRRSGKRKAKASEATHRRTPKIVF